MSNPITPVSVAVYRPGTSLYWSPEGSFKMSISRIESGKRMSQAVAYGNLVFLAGQVATDPSADVAGQTRQILSEIDRLLAAAGTDKTQILSTTIYLADIATFGDMNSVWDVWVPQGHLPARATVEAKLATPDYKVEIQVVAAR